MKNLFTKLIFGVFLLASLSSYAQPEVNAPHFTVKTSSGQNSNSALVLDKDQYQVLDQNGRVIEYHADKWNGSSWVKSLKGIRKWNSAGLLLEESVFEYDSNTGGWNNFTQKLYEYDSNNLLTFFKQEMWDSNTNTWVSAIEEKSTYNTDLLKVTYKKTYLFVANIVFSEYKSFSYDSLKRISETISYTETNGVLSTKYKEEYSYLGSNQNFNQILGFNESNGGWGLAIRRTKLTLTGNQKVYLYEMGEDGQFVPSVRDTETFTTNNTITSQVRETYSGTAFAWL
jgi:hypothetical protein